MIDGAGFPWSPAHVFGRRLRRFEGCDLLLGRSDGPNSIDSFIGEMIGSHFLGLAAGTEEQESSHPGGGHPQSARGKRVAKMHGMSFRWPNRRAGGDSEQVDFFGRAELAGEAGPFPKVHWDKRGRRKTFQRSGFRGG